MRSRSVLGAALAAALLLLGVPLSRSHAASAQTVIRVSTGYQIQRWWLPVYIGEQRGWFKQMGLDVTGSSFASGAPEIAAGASGSWDIGGAGNIPALLGAARYNLQTIGVADREEKIITIMALKDKAEDYLKNPSLLKGKTIPVTTNSTGQWGAATCLEKKFHLAPSDYHFVNLSPPEINAALSSGKYDVSEVWAPNTYTLESTIDAKVICTGADVNLPITSNLFVTSSFAKAHPDVVAKFLAVYEHAVAWENQHPKEAQKYLSAFYKSGGVQIPDQYLGQELRDRTEFDLAQQLKAMAPGPNGLSDFDTWMNMVGEFMKSVGTISSVPDPKSYITDTYMKMVEKDPTLRAFATNGKS
ncbi:MAG TPA: ABC transporter substrate-binding protein [Candidatus Acidoferrales bacterium]|nr:ABC transporter substrate-binding protein [Candidatus Acidoferrales bacterium]